MSARPSWFGSSATAEWYTPRHVLGRVARTLGEIELDPCSDDAHTVPAWRYFTAADDGLSRPWIAKTLYMNPPYGRGAVLPRWLGKLDGELAAGRVGEAIALVPARTETEWFRIMWRADALCFWYGRIQFGTATINAPFPSVLGYFGPHKARFMAAFCDAGKVIYP